MFSRSPATKADWAQLPGAAFFFFKLSESHDFTFLKPSFNNIKPFTSCLPADSLGNLPAQVTHTLLYCLNSLRPSKDNFYKLPPKQ